MRETLKFVLCTYFSDHWEPAASVKPSTLRWAFWSTQQSHSGPALTAAHKCLIRGPSAGYTLSRLTLPSQAASLYVMLHYRSNMVW